MCDGRATKRQVTRTVHIVLYALSRSRAQVAFPPAMTPAAALRSLLLKPMLTCVGRLARWLTSEGAN